MSLPVNIEATIANYEKYRQTAGGREDRFRAPAWLSSNSSLFFTQKKALRNGTVMGAALVMANTGIFQAGKWDLPGIAIYSSDPYYNENGCAALRELASSIFALKGMKKPPKEIRGMVNIVTMENLTPIRQKVPNVLTDGREVFMTTLQFPRKLLPNGVLGASIFPVIVMKKGRPDALRLPSRYWIYKQPETSSDPEGKYSV